MQRRRRGFTLIEVLVALAVRAVLATLALPSFGQRLARQRLVTTAEMLALDLGEARFEAARSGQALHLVFAAGPDWCYAVARAPGCDCRQDQACQVKVVRASDAPGVTLDAAQDAHFDPAALDAQGGGAVLSGMSGAQRLQIGLTPLGRPRLCSPTGLPDYPAC
jgi:type IV fimbrial biogenesis protein FimT